jgi:hypothetical protein
MPRYLGSMLGLAAILAVAPAAAQEEGSAEAGHGEDALTELDRRIALRPRELRCAAPRRPGTGPSAEKPRRSHRRRRRPAAPGAAVRAALSCGARGEHGGLHLP